MGSASAQINTDVAFEPGSIPGIVIYIFTTGKGLTIITIWLQNRIWDCASIIACIIENIISNSSYRDKCHIKDIWNNNSDKDN